MQKELSNNKGGTQNILFQPHPRKILIILRDFEQHGGRGNVTICFHRHQRKILLISSHTFSTSHTENNIYAKRFQEI